jgi:hypothetical protein
VSEPLDIDPAKAEQLARETDEAWAALLDHPVAGPFIRSFRILRTDEDT